VVEATVNGAVPDATVDSNMFAVAIPEALISLTTDMSFSVTCTFPAASLTPFGT